ncbi:SsgA family sporulation/cell division regulator [Streptomyces thermolineatus]|uniref:SsgA family sporulation/cell division regulator n=1 Tax=Streptomyces thermolineatus TaxID=44033 RepID=UPI00384E3571
MAELTVVERELELSLVLSPGHTIEVPAVFRYLPSDPYAVHVTFHVGSPSPVTWTFSRELLMEGVFRPCGHGDVRVWPAKAGTRGVVCMALTSPDGEALLEAPSSPVAAWLERTLRVVPPGTEQERLCIDEGIAGLLAPAALDELRAGDPRPGLDEAPDQNAGA